nr:hypothetical protein CFP56_62439 [Quercus suber]
MIRGGPGLRKDDSDVWDAGVCAVGADTFHHKVTAFEQRGNGHEAAMTHCHRHDPRLLRHSTADGSSIACTKGSINSTLLSPRHQNFISFHDLPCFRYLNANQLGWADSIGRWTNGSLRTSELCFRHQLWTAQRPYSRSSVASAQRPSPTQNIFFRLETALSRGRQPLPITLIESIDVKAYLRVMTQIAMSLANGGIELGTREASVLFDVCDLLLLEMLHYHVSLYPFIPQSSSSC